ncbi:hypothetical protein [Actinomadura sp. 9N407]|uniref:hypothetical protein n=1 Tax=Actinomadura sp. 9N407 TaxID=3375154 RepID=UPI0037B7C57E
MSERVRTAGRRAMAAYVAFWRRVDHAAGRGLRLRVRWLGRAVVVAVAVTALGAALLPVALPTPERTAVPRSASTGPAPSATRAVMPVVGHAQLRRALLKPNETGMAFGSRKLRRYPLGMIHDPQGVPTCYSRGVQIPGRVIEIHGRRKARGNPRVSDGYAVHAVAYANTGQARHAMGILRARAKRCPASSRYPRTPMSGGRYAVEHKLSWRVTGERSGGDWAMLRGIERKSYGRGWAEPNQVQRVTDYAQRGNVVIIQSLHLWRKSGTSDAPTLQQAARLLDRTVTRLGGAPCTWTGRHLACAVTGA